MEMPLRGTASPSAEGLEPGFASPFGVSTACTARSPLGKRERLGDGKILDGGVPHGVRAAAAAI